MGIPLFFLVISAGYFLWTKLQGGDRMTQQQVVVVRKTVNHTSEISGKFVPTTSMVITPRQSGRIIEIFVKEGAQVAQGAKLFSMKLEAEGQSELIQKRGEVDRLRLEVANQNQRLKDKAPVRELLGNEVYSKEENELAKLQLELKLAQDRLRVLETELGLDKNHRPVEKPSQKTNHPPNSSIVFVESPIDGIITLIDKRPGDFVLGGGGADAGTASRMVLVVADMSSLLVRTRVMEADLRFVKKDLPVKVRLDAYPEVKFEGHVSQIGGQGRTDTKADYTYFDVYVTLDQKDPRVLPEMNATVELIFASRENTLTLPVSAVAVFPDRAFVRIKDSSSPLGYVEQPVTVGVVTETEVEILSGLNEGDSVLELDFSTLDVFGRGMSAKSPKSTNFMRGKLGKGR